MAIDRDGTLKKAEKLLRQNRMDLAIAEYLRVVEDNPRDWSTANTLGELYAKGGQQAQAIEQYSRIAAHFVDEGFYPKAAAIYRKILKIVPDHEATLISLADVSARQGLLADARAHLQAIAARRRQRGDRRGAAEIVVHLGSLDPADFDARLSAARMLEEMGQGDESSARFRELHKDLSEKGRTADALAALTEAVRLNPLDGEGRAILAKSLLADGDVETARRFLDEHSAGADPELLLALAEVELRSGELPRARALLDRLLAAAPARRTALYDLGWLFIEDVPEAAFCCLDAAVDAAVAAAAFAEASTSLQKFAARVPGHIPALLKLVEVCVDGGLELAMYEAQEKLTDAYLAANMPAEARAIAEDLVAREPWEGAHIDRFRKALVMMRVSDPDMVIAERLSGQAPFMAHDPFFSPPPADEPLAPAEVSPSQDEAASAGPAPSPPEQPAVPEQAEGEAEHPALPPAEAAPVSVHAGADEVDLTGALGDLDTPSGQDRETRTPLDPVLAKMRDEAGVDPDFSAQHMTLARTYLEIGMLDEAQVSLETAVRSPFQRFEAAAALGRLHDRRGDSALAIEWLERATGAPAPTAEESRSLLYDLGVLLERTGETSRALAVFLELQSHAGDYGDVPARIERLARVQTGG